MTDLKDILNHEDELSSEELMRYLEGNATEEERFAIEKQMADSSFIDEAVEGLQNFKDPAQVKEYVEQLNKQLQKQTAKKASRKTKRKLKDQNWLIIAILAILLLCVTGFLLIHFTMKH
jgi:ferric-dicitrate binding protein FerR (iron transport regulator)